MKEIVVVGLGPGSSEHLTCGTWKLLQEEKNLVLRTGKHPLVDELVERGISFETLDGFYEKNKSFEDVYRQIVDYLFHKVAHIEGGRLVYAVPGHPLVAEETVRLLLQESQAQGVDVQIKAGLSFLDALYASLNIDPLSGLLVLDGLIVKPQEIKPELSLIFSQVYSRLVASDLKLALLEKYPPEHQAVIIAGAGLPDREAVFRVPLYQLDHLDVFDHLTSVYIEPLTGKKQSGQCRYPLDPLVEVMETLLSPRGCPWDREQDHQSLKPFLLEETYEVIEALDSGDMNKIQEELGDLLLQVVFHAILAQGRGDFTMQDVVEGICEKMIRRHPHVFADINVKNSEEVLRNWEQIKATEKGQATKGNPGQERIMQHLNKALPALLLAEEVQKRARKVGFDWPDIQGAIDKMTEEVGELREAIKENRNIEEELGDLLFAAVNVARFVKVSPEVALYQATQKFIRRFTHIEINLEKKGKKWKEMDLKQLDLLWEQAKKRDYNEK